MRHFLALSLLLALGRPSAACPGGGSPSCTSGKWEWAPLPKACEAAGKPAACPGGGTATCTDGKWACAPLPKK